MVWTERLDVRNSRKNSIILFARSVRDQLNTTQNSRAFILQTAFFGRIVYAPVVAARRRRPPPTDTYNTVRESDDDRQRPTGEWIHLRVNVFYVQCYYYALSGARSKDDITNLTSPIWTPPLATTHIDTTAYLNTRTCRQ